MAAGLTVAEDRLDALRAFLDRRLARRMAEIDYRPALGLDAVLQPGAARAELPSPLLVLGGAGAAQHFVDVFEAADVDAALAATVFHSGQIPIPELKRTLAAAGIEVRPC